MIGASTPHHPVVALWVIAVCAVLLVLIAYGVWVELARIRRLADGTVAPANTARPDLAADVTARPPSD